MALASLSEQFTDAEAAVSFAERAGASETDVTRGQIAVTSLLTRLQQGDDSIGAHGAHLALQSEALGTEDPTLLAAAVEAQEAYTLAFEMYPQVEALHSRLAAAGSSGADGSLDAHETFRTALNTALRHARPWIKSQCEWHSGNIQEHPTWMMDFDWSGDETDGAQRPLIYVCFPHLDLPRSWSNEQTAWRLTADGRCELLKPSYRLTTEFQPLSLPTLTLARAAHSLTVSWVVYDDRGDFEAQKEVGNPADASQWDPATCFPDRWPNVMPAPDEDGVRSLGDGGRPGDLVVFRLFVDERGLKQGPPELREAVMQHRENPAGRY